VKNYVQTTCRIEESLLKKVRCKVALNEGYSINSFINECIRYSLNNIVIVNVNE
jgi:predicted HicB family RNase H-like nuclease